LQIGPDMLKDGTVAVSSHSGRYNIIDTPGLNSKYPVSGGQIRSELSKLQSKQFLALLVLDACTARFVGHEREKLTEICVHFNPPMKIVVVWSKSNLLKEPGIADKVRELKNGDFFKGYALFEPSAQQYYTTENIREYLVPLMSASESLSRVDVETVSVAGASGSGKVLVPITQIQRVQAGVLV
jgi:hypothetical protein